MVDYLRVDGIEGAMAKRQIIDGVEKIGLALAIAAEKAVELGREVERRLTYVLEIEY